MDGRGTRTSRLPDQPWVPLPTLYKMETEGLLQSSQQVVGGRARRSYVATPKGRRTLESTKLQLRELANEVLGHEIR
jgi:DNA-binding PadR family transcriptional regulator